MGILTERHLRLRSRTHSGCDKKTPFIFFRSNHRSSFSRFFKLFNLIAIGSRRYRQMPFISEPETRSPLTSHHFPAQKNENFAHFFARALQRRSFVVPARRLSIERCFDIDIGNGGAISLGFGRQQLKPPLPSVNRWYPSGRRNSNKTVLRFQYLLPR